MQRRASLKFVFLGSLLIRHLLPAVDKPLLHGRNAFFFLDALLDARDFVVGLDVEFDFFAGECADPVGRDVSTAWERPLTGRVSK